MTPTARRRAPHRSRLVTGQGRPTPPGVDDPSRARPSWVACRSHRRSPRAALDALLGPRNDFATRRKGSAAGCASPALDPSAACRRSSMFWHGPALARSRRADVTVSSSPDSSSNWASAAASRALGFGWLIGLSRRRSRFDQPFLTPALGARGGGARNFLRRRRTPAGAATF
jgi:hypothetical protein